MMAGAAVKAIESAIAKPPSQPVLVVLEQQYEDGAFVGLCRTSEPNSAS